MLRIGRIPYLNCEPFFHRLQGVELVDLIPRRLGEAMAARELDAGPLSLIDYLRLETHLTPLPYGIGCPTGARSVLVFSERPLSELGGARVGITGETSTSVELLRVLLALRYEGEPAAWVGPEEPSDAVLLIGDPALGDATEAALLGHAAQIEQRRLGEEPEPVGAVQTLPGLDLLLDAGQHGKGPIRLRIRTNSAAPFSSSGPRRKAKLRR